MKGKELRSLERCLRWGKQGKYREVKLTQGSASFGNDKNVPTLWVYDGLMCEGATIDPDFTADIDTFLCEQKQETLVHSIKLLQDSLAKAEAGCK